MKKTLDHILKYPVLPVYYHDDIQTCTEVVNACYQGGIRVFEFVNRGDKAPENFAQLLAYQRKYWPDLLLGIGTIKTAAMAAAYTEIGAEFIVSPVVKEEIADITLKKRILWVPGCMTPTEISMAEDLGAPLVKLFPGDTLGTGFLKSIKPLFPTMRFMPTGGVNPTEESISGWFDAGVSAVGLGSKLFAKPEGATGYGWLADRAKELMGWVNA
ncbi:bifunctional 4-hydroxy-2-oxoglutarate aldolase/2-dehydro-3-deoxy-phosphogluconate aldolase [Parapedobacter pyrenivorans]|uniref:Bifunctional 4-hydroxy-2-oxoglutarate aldolase/2-dehydro-3-deoxy-phosphogluconate aldolase n=1 Tax=Parapedobacter pyrenivorans TaxID=1305674 RepID=A0A917HJW6_9SPHI|nr:bifunctional 4-hydroxy-2-oxoglutarate aldolase/2-dehydro-3-deoxy-phosphogluconate aldolase [Parapedobacter pyrenivorans]GGG81936.1 bifunctional 4-hydroxy-2-oxoglutarate aldolase/2-dehydro-3-deoxy-phosphogluconate aldolase [Parapedobacter pyrenivorans]